MSRDKHAKNIPNIETLTCQLCEFLHIFLQAGTTFREFYNAAIRLFYNRQRYKLALAKVWESKNVSKTIFLAKKWSTPLKDIIF